jgi:hypothetical protein
LASLQSKKERARQTFNKSAIYAGFIDAASGRFIKPGIAGIKEERTDTRDDDRNKNRNGSGDGGGSDGLNLDPLLIALLKKIPEAEGLAGAAALALVSNVRNERLANL